MEYLIAFAVAAMVALKIAAISHRKCQGEIFLRRRMME
jgi:hypothetical protein